MPRPSSLITLFVLAGCTQAPLPSPSAPGARVSEQVFTIFCKRVARDAYPDEPLGLRFDAPCAGEEDDVAGAPRLQAMVSHRPELVAALDRVFGDVAGSEAFESAPNGEGELDRFLRLLVPFYDDQSIPAVTRALARFAERVDGPALDTLARVSMRQGYRPAGENLALTRTLASYDGLDHVAAELLSVLGAEGSAHAAWLDALSALALELADDASSVRQADSWLRVASELLWRPIAPAADPLYVVARDEQGGARGDASTTPFPLPGRDDPRADARDAFGRLPEHAYRDAGPSFLTTLLGELHGLFTGEPDAIFANLARSLAPLFGAAGKAQTYRFANGRALTFDGLDLTRSPLLDLTHAFAELLRLPESERMLALLEELLRAHESELAGMIHVALGVDQLAAEDTRAHLSGWDGTPDTPSELWDDVIQFAVSTLDRPGQLEAVLRAYSLPTARAQIAMLAKFMEHSDQVTYPGPRVQAAERHSEEEVARYNAPIAWQLHVQVDRARPDHGMNRSLFQRLTSVLAAVNGLRFCNKPRGFLGVDNPLGGAPLRFPSPGGQAGADPVLTGLIDVLCPPPAPKVVYAGCDLLEQPNVAEAQMRAILGRFEVKLLDTQLNCLSEAGLAGDIGAQQAQLAQIDGYNLKPTPQAFARFTFVAPNAFLSNLVAPIYTLHGVPIDTFEPDYTFALEAPQDDVTIDDVPATFMDVARDLGAAFDDHELFEDTKNGPLATRGYRYADLLSMLHQHWPSPRAVDCPAEVEPGNEGCSQRLDARRPFYSQQSNTVSYEPVFVRAERELRVSEVFPSLMRTLAALAVSDDAVVVPVGTPGSRDGIAALAEFLAAVLRPTEGVQDRQGRAWTQTNACGLEATSAAAPARCKGERGTVWPQTSRLYLLLDALQTAERAWAGRDTQRRAWLAARSDLVDQLLTVDRDEGYRMHNQRARALVLEGLRWLRVTLLGTLHPRTGDRDAFLVGASGLASRLERLLAHPLTARSLALLEGIGAHGEAVGSLAALGAYLLEGDALRSVALAAADTLELADHDPTLTPLVQLAASSIAPDARDAQGEATVESGALYGLLELLRKVAVLPEYRGQAGRSPLLKLLKNASSAARTPLESVFDATCEVNRDDPTQGASAPMTARDNQRTFAALASFLGDDERGLERLYTVIASRHGGRP
jgi:hypothetical protein